MNIDGEGVKGEQRAVEYLLAEGYNVLDRNVEYARRGEIDIVCERLEHIPNAFYGYWN